MTPLPDTDSVSSMLSSYMLPLGGLALMGAGALYLVKRIGDVENTVGAMKRETVRNLTETDVRLIVQQMHRDGLIRVQQWEAPPPQQQQVQYRYAEPVKPVAPRPEQPTETTEQPPQNATPWVPRSRKQ